MPDYGDYTTNRLMMLEKYQMALGIIKPGDNKPAVCGTMKPGTNPISHSLLGKTYETLIKNRVPELANMPLDRLMEMPTYELKVLIGVIKEIHEKERAAEAAAKAKKNSMNR